MAIPARTCDVCSRATNDVTRYGLSRQGTKAPSEARTSWGRGSIDLCHDCWDRIARPNMKPQPVKAATAPA